MERSAEVMCAICGEKFPISTEEFQLGSRLIICSECFHKDDVDLTEQLEKLESEFRHKLKMLGITNNVYISYVCEVNNGRRSNNII